MRKIIKSPAKINLCLKVNFKRDDGYHDLSMIMQSISLYDTLEIEIFNKKNKNYNSKEKQIILESNLCFIPTDERNLVYKIVRYIFDNYNINDRIYIYLKKLIPTSGGLGGGSSDAASILLYLNSYYKLNLSKNELSNISSIFGSDIPFFIYNSECICEGRGEKITELKKFNDYFIVLATPNVRISTKDVFNKIDNFTIPKEKKQFGNIAFNNCVAAIKSKNLKLLTNNMFNDLEIVTETIIPDIVKFKHKMSELGALKTLMSGSGPTVYGIFNSFFKAINCKNILKNMNKEAFVYMCRPI